MSDVFPSAEYDAKHRDYVIDGQTYHVQLIPGNGWTPRLPNPLKHACLAAYRIAGKGNRKRFDDLMRMAVGTRPTPPEDEPAVLKVRTALGLDLQRRAKARELADALNAADAEGRAA